MEDSDYDYDEYFAKNLIDDTEIEKAKQKKEDKKPVGIKFTDELDFIISSKDDDISTKFSKSLKVSRTKGKSLNNRKLSSNSNKKNIKDKYDDDDNNHNNNDNDYFDNDSKNSSNNQKREINKKATLAAVLERQKRLEKIKEKTQKKEKSLQMMNGIELLFNVIKTQNIKILEDVRHEFKSSLPFNIDMETEFIKPPYLTPKIVSHKLERLLNQN
jgi:hypothetical protein